MKLIRTDGVLLVLLAGSLIANVAMNFRQGTAAAAVANKPALVVGNTVDPIQATTLRGDAVTLSYGPKPVVLYVMAPKCHWCALNTDNVRALWKQQSAQYTFVGLSMDGDGLDKYLADHSLPFPVYVLNLEDPALDKYGLGATPNMIVVSPEGKITRVWAGALTQKSLKSAETFFGITLPGLPKGT